MTEMEKLRRDAVKYKNMYPAGTRLVLEEMHDRLDPVPTGTLGTVTYVDAASNIHVDWDNGRTLAICPQVDEFRKLNPEEQAFDQSLIDFINNPTEIPSIKEWSDLVTYELPNPNYLLVIFADNIGDDNSLEYVIEPNQIIKGKLTIVGDCITCDFHDNEQLLKTCRKVIANTFPNSCRIRKEFITHDA